MIVVVCGDRTWTDYNAIYFELAALPKGTTIVHGACRGADMIAGVAARDLGLPVKEFPADWEKYGRAAGPIRNREMLSLCPDLVLAFHDDLNPSRGTKNTVEEARRRGIPAKLVSSTSKV